MSLTVAEASKRLSEAFDMPIKQAKEVYYKVFKIVVDALQNPKDRVQIPGVGSFSVVHKKERDGRNPSTGEAIHIPAHDVIVFKAYKPAKQDKKVAKPAKKSPAKAPEVVVKKTKKSK